MMTRVEQALRCSVVLLLAMPAEGLALDLYLSPSGTAAGDGRSLATACGSLEQVHQRLQALRPAEAVRVRIAPGAYFCAGMDSAWTWVGVGGLPTTIEPLEAVPAPAVTSAVHPGRPRFFGLRADGTPCPRSVWMPIEHGKVSLNLTIQGLTVTRYRGALSITGTSQEITRVNQNIDVYNMVFERIGDLYFQSSTPGKGAILLNFTFGNQIEGNFFHQIRNGEATAGLVHPIYFARTSARNVVMGNTFVGASGSALKVTHGSSQNSFVGNDFASVAQVYTDRWCGSRRTPADLVCAATEPQCPSWNNFFDLTQNRIGRVFAARSVAVDPIPEGQVCAYPAPASGVRFSGSTALFGAAGGSVLAPLVANPVGRSDVCGGSRCTPDCAGVHTASLDFDAAEANCELNIGANPTLSFVCCHAGVVYRRALPVGP